MSAWPPIPQCLIACSVEGSDDAMKARYTAVALRHHTRLAVRPDWCAVCSLFTPASPPFVAYAGPSPCRKTSRAPLFGAFWRR